MRQSKNGQKLKVLTQVLECGESPDTFIDNLRVWLAQEISNSTPLGLQDGVTGSWVCARATGGPGH